MNQESKELDEEFKQTLIVRTSFYTRRINEIVLELLVEWIEDNIINHLIKSNAKTQESLQNLNNKSNETEVFNEVDFLIKKTIYELSIRLSALNEIHELSMDDEKQQNYIDKNIDKLKSDEEGFSNLLMCTHSETLTEEELALELENEVKSWVYNFMKGKSGNDPESFAEFQKEVKQVQQERLKQDKELKDNLKQGMI